MKKGDIVKFINNRFRGHFIVIKIKGDKALLRTKNNKTYFGDVDIKALEKVK